MRNKRNCMAERAPRLWGCPFINSALEKPLLYRAGVTDQAVNKQHDDSPYNRADRAGPFARSVTATWPARGTSRRRRRQLSVLSKGFEKRVKTTSRRAVTFHKKMTSTKGSSSCRNRNRLSSLIYSMPSWAAVLLSTGSLDAILPGYRNAVGGHVPFNARGGHILGCSCILAASLKCQGFSVH